MKSLILRFLFVVVVLSLAAANVRAKEWQVITSFPGNTASRGLMYIGGEGGPCSGNSCWDFDGDGVQDMAMNKKEMAAKLLVIISGADPSQIWTIPLPASISSGYELVGFLNFDGTINKTTNVMNKKEMAFALKENGSYVNPVMLYNVDATAGIYEVRIWDQGTILIGGWDTDGDGVFELVIGDQNKNEVQVWGFR